MEPSTPTPLVIACSLTAGEMPVRLREIAAIGEAALLDSHVLGRHATLRFAAHDGIRSRLDAIIAAESSCCGFLTFDLHDYGDQLAIRIDAPQDAQLVLEELVAAFTPARDAA
jgi:hypothetical protein